MITVSFHDLTLAAKIKAAFAQAEDVSAMDINLDVKNGVVSMSGHVSKKEHDRAIEVAKGIDGVTSVEDHMSVTSNA